MTYNTLTGRNDCAGCKAMKAAGLGDELKLSARLPVVAEKVQLADPDIIGFQENEGADPLPQTRLATLLPEYAWANPDATVPIAVRSSRFTVVDSGVEQLEKGARKCIGRDRTNGRFASWALLRETATERELWVFNTHLHPYDQAACADLRAANVARLAELVTAKNPDGRLPQLILGDFNAFGDETRERFSAHLTTLRELGMADAAAIAAQDDSDVPNAASAGWMTATVKGRSQVKVVRTSGRHIDFIWVPQDAEVASWAVLSGPGVEHRRIRGVKVPVWSGVMGSDHSPVVARLALA
ncbi:endonuclease/exonuclease/phosphatase family protein [Micropruina sp.]|uniref:endonuclease/exonuclease/phosphatase family protein n=1 Tax=Micropruina sp. TaxID=2737536 RepID=UPI002637D7F6|nr:endonuclease/exonuclease/phosphatase family protein [Micropruina sp.]